MITLDTNLTLYPGLYYYLPTIKSQNSNAYSVIDQYADAQASKNATATQNTQQTDKTNTSNPVITDTATLIEALKLNIPQNRLEILKLLTHSELVQFLFLLEKEQLLSGLNLFTKDKLLHFIGGLSKQDLLKMLNKMFISPEQILGHMSIKDLNKFLSSKKIEKSDLIKIFQSLSTTELTQIAESATGIPQGNKTQAQLLKTIEGLSASQVTDGIKGLEYKKMFSIVSSMLKQDPTLYTEFSQEALFEQTTNFAKSTLVQGMGELGTDQLIGFLDKLPDNLIALVDTQIDTETLAQILISDYQNLLSSIAG